MKRRWAGAALLLAGVVLTAAGLWPESSPWEMIAEPVAVPDNYQGAHPIEALARWQLQQSGDGRRLTLYLARYVGEDDRTRQALLPPPGTRAWRNWQALGAVLRRLEPDALILAWWDDAQRVDLLSGRAVWSRQPPAAAFPPRDRDLWRRLSGGFDEATGRLRELARWLAGSTDTALAALRRETPQRPRYLLVSTGILARLDEIQRLAGTRLPLEVRIFPPGDNLHARIAAVQRWAGKTGFGYLPQKVPAGTAAWRLTGKSDALLVRLLPFTATPPAPPPGLIQVFQSPDRRLRLYRLQ